MSYPIPTNEKERLQAPHKIVAITANVTVEDRNDCLNAGMDDYISKPFHLNELTTAIKKAYEERN